MQFDRNFVDELKARIKLSDVVGRKVRLIRRGREFVALSPFSNEKSPSFTINDDKGFYHCFSSGKSGDAITFLMETESLCFQEAIEKLAGDVGMELPRPVQGDARAGSAWRDQRDSLYSVLQRASAFFVDQLAQAGGANARAYLDKRQVPPALRQAMGLGFAPSSRTLLCDTMLQAGVTPDQLLEAGLAIRPDNGGAIYDRFRDRVIFPITDNNDRVIAFGGRAMSADAQAKYLNSPETALFHKGNILYNLANARRAMHPQAKRRGLDTLIVAEGYMDVIALTRAGFGNAVAPLGTALTEAQMAMLWRLCPEPILCFDGDGAGLRAMLRVVERALPLLTPGHSLRFALLPDGLDPDDIITRQGPEAMAEHLAKPLPLADILWSAQTSQQPHDTPERRAGLEQRLKTLLATIADPGVRKYYQDDMRQRTIDLFRPAQAPARSGPAFSAERGRFRGQRQNFATPVGVGPATSELKRTHLAASGKTWNPGARRERVILLTVINHPALLESHFEDFCNLRLTDPALDRLRSVIIELTTGHSNLENGSLRSHLVNQGFKVLLDDLCAAGAPSGDRFCEVDTAFADVQTGWLQTVRRHHSAVYLHQELIEMEQALAADFSVENEQNLMILQQQLAEDAEEGLIPGYGEASGWGVKS